MSAGSPIIKTRISESLLKEIQECIARRNNHTQEQPWDTSDFIRAAVREKIKHMRRARRPRKRKPPAADAPAVVQA